MARPRKELEDIKISRSDFNEHMVNVAVKKQIPLWIAEEIIPSINNEQSKRITEAATRFGEVDYLCKIFPELKNKIKYRYETPREKSDRTMFRDRLRTLVRCNLESNGIIVRSMTESMIEFILGYKINDLMTHLESQFTAKMEWKTQGSVWHLDHIYPCAKLRFESVHDSNFIKLWSMDNLRPLCKYENIKKGSKIIECGE